MITEEGLKREVGIWGLTSNIVNVVIGSGIFILPALVSEALGPSGIFAYIICSILISLVMLCFAELGSKITITGGAYAYIEVAFGKYAGFLTTNIFIFGASLMATAAIANAIADTLSFLMPVFKETFFRVCFFVVLFSGLTLINVMGIKQGIRLVKITTIAKLIPLLLLIILGIKDIIPANLKIDTIPAISEFGKISVILFFAFQGAENSLSVGGEVKNPSKTFPRAILLGFLFILLLYLAVQLVAQGVLGASLSTFKQAPLAGVANRVIGPFGLTLMTAGAAISMFGYLSSDIMNMPRVLFRSALDNIIPIKPLAGVHKKYSTPYVSVIVFTGLSCFFAIIGEFEQLAILSSCSVLLIYLGVALATIKLRVKEKDSHHFKIPGGYMVPALAIITILWFLSNLRVNEQKAMLIFVAILTLIYFAIRLLKLDKGGKRGEN
jgi:amino acid transporter